MDHATTLCSYNETRRNDDQNDDDDDDDDGDDDNDAIIPIAFFFDSSFDSCNWMVKIPQSLPQMSALIFYPPLLPQPIGGSNSDVSMLITLIVIEADGTIEILKSVFPLLLARSSMSTGEFFSIDELITTSIPMHVGGGNLISRIPIPSSIRKLLSPARHVTIMSREANDKIVDKVIDRKLAFRISWSELEFQPSLIELKLNDEFESSSKLVLTKSKNDRTKSKMKEEKNPRNLEESHRKNFCKEF
ncbi:hypothetical protein HZH68_009869 [Vespula germanica]|uniref:Uncharacterized protein n=1 Tax=Vespula germanica TaxID=30212 RepID=A0A834JZE8_VESGE|nr:hypothetical protein HZH68_009869 [Vespula germanica]